MMRKFSIITYLLVKKMATAMVDVKIINHLLYKQACFF